MSRPAVFLKPLRQLHLYLGVFITPSILFFAITGAMQSINLHEILPGRDYKPAAWIVMLAQVHKKQTTEMPVHKPRPDGTEKKSAKAEKPLASASLIKAADTTTVPPKRHLPLKIFFVLVSLALTISTFSGIYMAYKYSRNKLLIAVLLAAGVFVPLFLLRF